MSPRSIFSSTPARTTKLPTKNSKSVQLLARQPIDLDRPHPYTAAGNTEFNCLLWMAPNEQRAGNRPRGLNELHYAIRRNDSLQTSGGILPS
jgi:hypothetical protein